MTEQPPKRDRDRLTITVPFDLKRKFDALCRLKGANMSVVTEDLIEEWVKENAPPGFLGEDKNR